MINRLNVSGIIHVCSYLEKNQKTIKGYFIKRIKHFNSRYLIKTEVKYVDDSKQITNISLISGG